MYIYIFFTQLVTEEHHNSSLFILLLFIYDLSVFSPHPSPLSKYVSQSVCLSVCLSVSPLLSPSLKIISFPPILCAGLNQLCNTLKMTRLKAHVLRLDWPIGVECNRNRRIFGSLHSAPLQDVRGVLLSLALISSLAPSQAYLRLTLNFGLNRVIQRVT